MFDKLEDLIHHYEELMNLLSEPDVANDANRFKKLMKQHFLQRKSTVCMCTTQRTEAGRWRHLMPMRLESAV